MRKCGVEGKNGCGVSRRGPGSAGGIKSCTREKQDERKENDEHQRKGDSGREVSDWLPTSFCSFVCLRIVLNASHLRDFHLL